MHRLPKGSKVLVNDALLKVWRLPDGSLREQRKRVPANCPLSADERAAYSYGATVHAVAYIKNKRNCSLADALNLLNTARGGSPLARRQLTQPPWDLRTGKPRGQAQDQGAT